MAGPKSLQTPRSERCTLATANTAVFDPGAGAVVAGFVGATGGSVVRWIVITARQDTVAGAIRGWKRITTGPTFDLLFTIPVKPRTVGAYDRNGDLVPPWSFMGAPPCGEILLPDADHQLYYTTHTGDDFSVVTVGGNWV